MITAEVLARLAEHKWPGNVRELANVIERAVIMSGAGPIQVEHLPGWLEQVPATSVAFTMPVAPMTLREVEREVVLGVLDRHGGDKPQTAAELGIALKTLYNKINQYNAPVSTEDNSSVPSDGSVP